MFKLQLFAFFYKRLNVAIYFFHQPFQTIPVTGVRDLSQLKDALTACEIEMEPELFGGWIKQGENI